MIVLAIDTCLNACSAAVVDGDNVLAEASEPMIRGHQERLAPLTKEVMEAAGIDFVSIDRIGVTVGPGSFTGLRVGLAFAKGLALALDRPCIGVGCLEALASGLRTEGLRAAVIDAGRDRVFMQLFDGQNAIVAPDSLEITTAAAWLAELVQTGELTLTGPGAGLLSSVAPGASIVDQGAASPVVVARVAGRSPIIPPRPLYLRAPDAKPKAA